MGNIESLLKVKTNDRDIKPLVIQNLIVIQKSFRKLRKLFSEYIIIN